MASDIYTNDKSQKFRLFTLKEETAIFNCIAVLLSFLHNFSSSQKRSLDTIIHLMVDRNDSLYTKQYRILCDLLDHYKIDHPKLNICIHDNVLHGGYYRVDTSDKLMRRSRHRINKFEKALDYAGLTREEFDDIINEQEHSSPVAQSSADLLDHDVYNQFQMFMNVLEQNRKREDIISQESSEFVAKKMAELVSNP